MLSSYGWVHAMSSILKQAKSNTSDMTLAAECLGYLAVQKEWTHAWTANDVMHTLTHLATTALDVRLKPAVIEASNAYLTHYPSAVDAYVNMEHIYSAADVCSARSVSIGVLLEEISDLSLGSTLEEQHVDAACVVLLSEGLK